MKRAILFSLMLLLFAGGVAHAKPQGSGFYAYVAIWDVKPGQTKDFEAGLRAGAKALAADRSFYNERILRNIDTLTYHYATYTKGTDRDALERAMQERIAALRPFLRRDPEVHVAAVTRSYYPDANAKLPAGTEFGRGAIGQIAHLGLFIPYPEFRGEYDRTLDHVKVFTRDSKPRGYLGEDVLAEVDVVAPESQTPYSPRVAKPSRMSINYGEYASMEDAENSYIKRGNDRPTDPQIMAWERIFYSSLQVPTRFYIFSVIDNVAREPQGRQPQRPGRAGR